MNKILMTGAGISLLMTSIMLAGCEGPDKRTETFLSASQLSEPAWIRNGEPIEFENSAWFPTDDVESLLDSEVYQAGEYRDIWIFIDKTDVRPFERLYTRFAKNRYRAFEKQP